MSEMFGLGMQELIIILIVFILIMHPILEGVAFDDFEKKGILTFLVATGLILTTASFIHG